MCSKGSSGGAGPKPCHLMLRHCLAVQLRKEGCQGDPGEFWMYDSGYLLFQGLLAANSVCWWNGALSGATRGLSYRGYVAPGALLVTAEPCALEIVRSAWARRVLKPPAGYVIVSLGDIEDCLMTPIAQGHFTPLPEAVCEVVLQLTSQGKPAVIESVRRCLADTFPHIQPPDERVLYDTLSQLTTERKIYQTARGYFIVTPERRRSRSHSRGRRRIDDNNSSNGKGLLMSTEEALVLVHGEMATIRDGDVTHQCIQTNLADVICGGNASDKVLYPRSNKRRSASFPAQRTIERRGSFRLWGSNRRLRRSASTRTIAKNCTTDSSSSTEYPTSSDSATTPKKVSLLSRLFRRSKRTHCHIKTFSAQFPPTEWFNSRAIHLHSVATQTTASDKETASTIPYYFDNSELSSARSATLPRRHRRQPSNESACATSFAESREHSPNLKHRSPSRTSSTLPRSTNLLKVPRNSARLVDNSRKASRSNLSKNVSNSDIQNDRTDHKAIVNDVKPTPQNSHSSTNKSPSHDSLKASHNNLPNPQNNSTQKERENKINENSRVKTVADTDNGTILLNSDTYNNGECRSDSTGSSNFSIMKSNLDNSGPSSIESQSTKTISSHNTTGSGPSSLESNRTVISQRQHNSGPSSLDSQSTITEYKTSRKSPKSSPRRKDIKNSPKPAPHVLTTKPKIPHSNSFTLQVTTNQNGTNYSANATNATTTATINSGNGGNTKIYVQNSPVRSVITFENGQNSDPNVVIINGTEAIPITESTKLPNRNESIEKPTLESQDIRRYQKNVNSTQSQNYEETNLNNSRDPILAPDGVLPSKYTTEEKNETMNNSRKLSLQLTPRDSLSYKNVLKNVPSSSCNQFSSNSNPGSPVINSCRDFTKNSFASNPPSPTKSFDSIGGSIGNMYYDKYLVDSKSTLEKSYDQDLQSSTNNITKIVEKNTLGSEPNLSCKIVDSRNKTLTRENSQDYQFPSLSDLSFNFTSLAAQKILKGVSINSIDTLVELNMAANAEKQNNCDVVQTDFGLV